MVLEVDAVKESYAYRQSTVPRAMLPTKNITTNT